MSAVDMFPNLSSLSTNVGMLKEVTEYMKDRYLVRRLHINVTIMPLAVKTPHFNPDEDAGFNFVRLNVSSNLEELLKSIADWPHATNRNQVLSEWIVAVLRVTAQEIAPKVRMELNANNAAANQQAPPGANMYRTFQYSQSHLPSGYENAGVPPDATKGEFGYDFVIGLCNNYGQPERIVQQAEIDPLCYTLLRMDWAHKVQARLDVIWNKSRLDGSAKPRQLPKASQLSAPEFEKLEVLDDSRATRLYTTRITYRLMLQANLEWLLRRLQEEDFAKPYEDNEDDGAPPPPKR